MKNTEYALTLCLTQFDGGAASAVGDGAASGETQASPADTGAGKRADKQAEGKEKTGQPEQVPNAGEQMDEQKAAQDDMAARKAEFERLVTTDYKDIYAERTQRLIDNRFREAKAMQSQLEKAQPILDRVMERYGVYDTDELLKAIDEDESYYEQEAAEKGLTVEQLKAFKRMERENENLRRAAEERHREEQAQKVYGEWMQQAEKVKEIYPSFDLNAECENPEFVGLLQNHIDVKTAYEVLHRDEIMGGVMAYTAQQVKQQTVRDIQARGLRPSENGVDDSPAVVTKMDVKNMTRAQREELEKRALRGERITF